MHQVTLVGSQDHSLGAVDYMIPEMDPNLLGSLSAAAGDETARKRRRNIIIASVVGGLALAGGAVLLTRRMR